MPSRSGGNDKSNGQSNDRGGKSGGKGGSKRGFAAMNPEEQREIAHEGGAAVSRNREHMSEIGRKGAEARNAARSRSQRGGTGGDQSIKH